MTKKLCVATVALFFIILVFSNNVMGYTKEEIQEITTQILEQSLNQNSKEEIKNLEAARERLNNLIVEETDSENREILQKTKFNITKKILSIEMLSSQESLENATYGIGYQSPVFTSNNGNGVSLIKYQANFGTPTKVAFKGQAEGVDTSLASNEGLYCIQKGVSLPSVQKNKVDGKDATLVVKDINGNVTYSKYIDREYAIGEVLQDSQFYETTRKVLEGINLNRYGKLGIESTRYYTFETARTIAKYGNIKSALTAGESYIYSQSQINNSGSYPAVAQQASWIYNGQMDNSTNINISNVDEADIEELDSLSATLDAQQLAAEATRFEELSQQWTTNKPTVTGDASKCEVKYNKSENSFYVGPITLQYDRETYPIANGATSSIEQMQSQILKNHVPGLVEFSGINDIVCYDEKGRAMTGVSFIINNKVQRQSGDDSYIFPYPNEEFYVKIPVVGNETSSKFAKMSVEIFYLSSTGTAATLTGTYVEQTFGGIAVPQMCTCSVGVCAHGSTVQHDNCRPIYCRDCYQAGYLVRLGTSHAKAFVHYIMAINSEQKQAQSLKQPQCAEICICFDKIDIEINKDLVMEISGTVWEDERSDKASDNNGLIDEKEKRVQGIRVVAYLDGQEVSSTYTDVDGKYKFEKLRIGDYIIGFEYDGQTYMSTKYLAIRDASGNITWGDLEAYRRNKTAEIYKINSKATEVEAERQAFNNKFYEVTENKAIATDGTQNTLQYNTENRRSTLITLDSNNTVLDLYKMQSRTAVIDFDSVVVENINFGIVKRPKADFALNMDVYQSHVRVKNVYQTYTYNQRQLESVTNFETLLQQRIDQSYQAIDTIQYTQNINRADYDWEWDETLVEIYPDKYRAELQVYIDYKIVIRNQSEKASGKITELVNNFDAELIYTPTTPVSDMSSWVVLKTEGENPGKQQVVWNSTSKYGNTKAYTGYNTMYTNSLENIELQPGETAELHIIYAVKKDGKIILDENDEGKKNIIEINGYQTFLDGKIEGKIEQDSNPGNAIPDNKNDFEDDTDMAPYFRLVFDQTAGNVIEGNAWEDARTETLANNQIVGNGIREKDKGEKDIGGILVELVEVHKNSDTGVEVEKVVKSTTTAYTSNGIVSDGGYRFEQIPSGTYRIKFTYGTEGQLQNNLKYNGQDYQATIVNGKIEQSAGADVQVVFVIDVSGSMSGHSIASVKTALCGENGLLKNLAETMPGIEMGLVTFTSSAQVVSNITSDYQALSNAVSALSVGGGTAIHTGVNTGTSVFTANIDKKKVMVILTDGGSDISAARASLENALAQDIYPIGITVGGYATNIFGTQENPYYGPVYEISSQDIVKVFTEDIYMDIGEYISIMENRSYATEKAIATDSISNEVIGAQSRLNTMVNFKNLTNENGKIIHLADIEKMADGSAKQEAISNFANSTYVTAMTTKLRISSKAKTGGCIRQVNLGLVERPKVELKVEEEIAGIKVILSNGNVLIDTANGLDNYVQGLDKADKGVPVSISMDSELQQGATIEVKYRIRIINTGEVDTLESYFDHYEQNTQELNAILSAYTDEEKAILSSYFNNNKTVEKTAQSVIPTKPTTVYNYINKNMVFRQEINPEWEVITDTSILAENVRNSIDSDITVLKLKDGLIKNLYPTSTVGIPQDQTYIETYLTLSKTMSPQSSDDTLVYTNSTEIVQRQNAVGRRDYLGLPGNYVPNTTPTEYDSAKVRDTKVVPPYGQTRIYYVLGITVALVLIAGVLISKKIVKKTKEE